VQRTCDAVAIVDRGKVIRQGPIAELLAGTAVVLEIDCSEPDRARESLARTELGASIDVTAGGLAITLPAGTTREVVAEVARVLVAEGIAVYRLQPLQASLEAWFLSVTSRLGDPQ
jgi:ABC-2 type transport system ATP-binding protein